MIRDENAPAGLAVDGLLALNGVDIRTLPRGLTVRWLRLSDCSNLQALPDGLCVRHLEIHQCPQVTALPAGLRCYELDAPGSNLTGLPADLAVEYRLNLAGSPHLRTLPAGLAVSSLSLRDCTALAELPEGLSACFLDLGGCTQLTGWPKRLDLRIGRLNLSGCARLTAVPPGLARVAQLDLSGCAGIRDLPDGLRVDSWIDVGGSGLTGLPPSLAGVRLRWRGVVVDERVAFRPETLTADDILRERNAEVRRVMLERVGLERFFDRAGAEVLGRDRDAGGDRRLLRVALGDDEPLVCVAVSCPSTGRRYVLRVPPTVTTCRQAVAWMAGFDDPDDYNPLAET